RGGGGPAGLCQRGPGDHGAAARDPVAGAVRVPGAGDRGHPGQSRHLLDPQVGPPGRAGRAGAGTRLGRPVRRDRAAAPDRRRSGPAGTRRAGPDGGRAAGPAQHPRAAVGRGPAAVPARPPGPGRGRPDRAAGHLGAGRSRLRRGRDPGLRHFRPGRRRTGHRRSGRIEDMTEQTNAARLRELNDTIRYTMWSVFQAVQPLPAAREELTSESEELLAGLADKSVVVRGTYDVTGLRADADLMVWWHAGSAEALQDAYGLLRRTRLGAHLRPVWSQLALHR